MLTPVFELSQDEEVIIITIKAPYAKISETEIFIEECDFRFHSKPYFLRLTLPGPVIEDGREQAKYDTDSGSFTIRVPKVNAGEHFDGLDMLTQLLAPSGDRNAKAPRIEVLEQSAEVADASESGGKSEDEEDFDWQIEQSPPLEDSLVTDGPKYGFASQRSDVFKRLQEELHDVIDLPEADKTPVHMRAELRHEQEKDAFDDEHYMADFCDEDGIIQCLLDYKTDWGKHYHSMKQGKDINDLVTLTFEEKEVLRSLPRKQYLLSSISRQEVYLGLVDILFGYAYNHRVTEGENTVESGWTICKISGTLSWLQTYGCVKDALIYSYRGSLCHPLYRSWRLSALVHQDVYQLLKLGRRSILKCFLEVRSILGKSENRYILNDLYINDYCIWIQSASKKKFDSLADSLKEVSISKAQVGFDLEILEQACKLAVEEASNEDLSLPMSALQVQESYLESSPNSEHVVDSTQGSGSDYTDTESRTESEDSDCKSEEKSEDKQDSLPCVQLRNLSIGGCSNDQVAEGNDAMNVLDFASGVSDKNGRNNDVRDQCSLIQESDARADSCSKDINSENVGFCVGFIKVSEAAIKHSGDEKCETVFSESKDSNTKSAGQCTENHDMDPSCLPNEDSVQQNECDIRQDETKKQAKSADSSSLNF